MLVGSAAGNNGIWLGATIARAAVRSIDGIPIMAIRNVDEAHALWDRVDAEATEAVNKHLIDKDEAETKAFAKNFSAPQASGTDVT